MIENSKKIDMAEVFAKNSAEFTAAGIDLSSIRRIEGQGTKTQREENLGAAKTMFGAKTTGKPAGEKRRKLTDKEIEELEQLKRNPEALAANGLIVHEMSKPDLVFKQAKKCAEEKLRDSLSRIDSQIPAQVQSKL